jgi:hypothetical protein
MSFHSASASGFGNANSERGNAPSIADQIERMPHALTVRELKALLQVSDQTIYRMIAAGFLRRFANVGLCPR